MSSRSVFRRPSLLKEVCFLCLATLSPLLAEKNLADEISSEVRQVFDERRNAVVRIEAYDRHGKLSGTGFFIDPSGTIFTLAGIVAGADEISIVQGEKRIPAKLLLADPRSGVALLKADCTSDFIPVGKAQDLPLATPVMAIGFPQDLEITPTFGILGGFDRKFLDQYFVTTHLRATMPVLPGFSGAPLLNLQGEAIGMIVAGIANGGACFALPIEAAEKIRTDYARFGAARHGWVGVTVEENPTEVEGSRVRIAELNPDTPAAKAGLRDGDILLQVGQTRVKNVEDVIDAAYYLTADTSVAVQVARDGQTLNIDVISRQHPTVNPDESAIGTLEGLSNNLKLGDGK